MPVLPVLVPAPPDGPELGAVGFSSPTDRADLFFCLAAAFRAPPAGMRCRDWCEALAADLDDLAPAIGPAVAVAAQALRQAAHGPLADADWLVEYSRLFLVPPVKVTLNAGMYLEGGLGGTAPRMIEACYARAGFRARDDFHDLPDHVALQLEFLGELLDRSATGDADALELAEAFVEDFVTGWAQPLHGACGRALGHGVSAAAPYRALSQLVVDLLDS